MNTLVLYETQYGNTHAIAELIGKELEAQGTVRVTDIVNYQPSTLIDVDLLVIGAPTQAHGMTPAMKDFVDKLESRPAGLAAVVFDTRVRGPMLIWGSAARAIAPKLQAAGFKLILAPENFTVSFARPPHLDEGEQEHARTWAGQIAGAMKLLRAVAA